AATEVDHYSGGAPTSSVKVRPHGWPSALRAIREVELSQRTWEPPEKKRRVPYLFIQADEDHVGNQDGPRWHPRLVTVHEGVEGPSWRKRLINAQHFGGLYSGRNEALWHEVWQDRKSTRLT